MKYDMDLAAAPLSTFWDTAGYFPVEGTSVLEVNRREDARQLWGTPQHTAYISENQLERLRGVLAALPTPLHIFFVKLLKSFVARRAATI